MLYIIVFALGGMFGVTLMCLLQINRMGTDAVSGEPLQRKGELNEQQQSKRA